MAQPQTRGRADGAEVNGRIGGALNKVEAVEPGDGTWVGGGAGTDDKLQVRRDAVPVVRVAAEAMRVTGAGTRGSTDGGAGSYIQRAAEVDKPFMSATRTCPIRGGTVVTAGSSAGR